jgi:hypothetical protein
MWECRSPFFHNKHIGNISGLGDLDIADSPRGEAEVAAKTEDGAVGSLWVGWDASYPMQIRMKIG